MPTQTTGSTNEPTDLGFRPRRRMTRWYEPIGMIRLLLRIRATMKMQDQRQQQPEQPSAVFDFADAEGDFWFDYAADLGDAFDPTVAVAWHMGRRGFTRNDIDPRIAADPEFGLPDQLPLPPEDDIPSYFPRGSLLILGGDEVYPNGSDSRYRNQVLGPYELGWEGVRDETAEAGEDRAGLLALPANHDWYGGIEPFVKAFASDRSIGGWQTQQKGTWWSARLAHDWWVWGIDTALDGTVNSNQLEYFRSVRNDMPDDARLIACVPVPLWRLRERHVDHLDHLARFFFRLGVEPEVYLSGDYHIASLHRRDRADDGTEWHLTSGGGGAFQHPVHNLDLSIPNEYGGLPEPQVADSEPFRKIASWPSNAVSRAETGGWQNILFDKAAYSLVAVLALIVLAVMKLTGADRRGPDDNLRSVVDTFIDQLVPAGAVAAVALTGLATFVLAKANSSARGATSWARGVGLAHGLVQSATLLAAATGANIAVRRTTIDVEGLSSTLVAAATMAVVAVLAGVASIIILGTYLQVANQQFRMHDNESYSARHSGDNRHFARFRISPDGSLSCYVIALSKTGQGWAKAFRRGEQLPPDSTSSPELIDVRFRTTASNRIEDPADIELTVQ